METKIKLKNGSSLMLRHPQPEDAPKILEYLNTVGGESDNLLFGAGEFTLTEEQEAGYIKRVNEDPNDMMIIGLIDNKIATVAQITCPSRKRIVHNSDLAISVKKEYWHCGVGTAVMTYLTDYAKKTGFIKNVGLSVKSENERAIKLYERFGFKKIGVHKNFFFIDGKYYDDIMMDLELW